MRAAKHEQLVEMAAVTVGRILMRLIERRGSAYIVTQHVDVPRMLNFRWLGPVGDGAHLAYDELVARECLRAAWRKA